MTSSQQSSLLLYDEDAINNDINDSSASSDFFSPISCFGAGSSRQQQSGKLQQQQPRHSAEKLPKLHDSSWIGARLSPIGSFDQEAANDDEDDDEDDGDNNLFDDDDEHDTFDNQLSTFYHKALHESLERIPSLKSTIITKRQHEQQQQQQRFYQHQHFVTLDDDDDNNDNNRYYRNDKNNAANENDRGTMMIANERTSLLRSGPAVTKIGRNRIHPLWDDENYLGTHPSNHNNKHENNKNNSRNPYHHHFCGAVLNPSFSGASSGDSTVLVFHTSKGCCKGTCVSWGTIVSTISGLYLLAMMGYDCYMYFSTGLYRYENNNTDYSDIQQQEGEDQQQVDQSYGLQYLPVWKQTMLHLLQHEEHEMTWMVRPRWSTCYLFGAMLPSSVFFADNASGRSSSSSDSQPSLSVRLREVLLVAAHHGWRLVSSSFMTTSLVEWLVVWLAWRLIFLAATRVPWHYWSSVFFVSCFAGQLWMLAWQQSPSSSSSLQYGQYDYNSYYENQEEEHNQQQQGNDENAEDAAAAADGGYYSNNQHPFALAGCLAWGTCGVLCHVGMKSPSRRVGFFFLAKVLMVLSLAQQKTGFGSVWGAVGGSFFGWAWGAASEAKRTLLKEQRRRGPDEKYNETDHHMYNLNSHPLLQENNIASKATSAQLFWMQFFVWLYRVIVLAILIVPTFFIY